MESVLFTVTASLIFQKDVFKIIFDWRPYITIQKRALWFPMLSLFFDFSLL